MDAASPALSSKPGMSEGARIVKVFIEPVAAFASLDRKPRWWAPWLLISVANMVFAFILVSRVDLYRLAQREMEQSPGAEQVFSRLTPAQQQAQLKFTEMIYKVSAYISPAITFLEMALTTLVLMFFFRILFKMRIQWPRALGIVAYASLPQLVFIAITCIALARSPEPDSFDLHNPIASNPAFLLGSNNGSFSYGLLEGLDIGNIWIIILLGVGFAAAAENRRISPFVATGAIGGLYAFYVFVHSAISVFW